MKKTILFLSAILFANFGFSQLLPTGTLTSDNKYRSGGIGIGYSTLPTFGVNKFMVNGSSLFTGNMVVNGGSLFTGNMVVNGGVRFQSLTLNNAAPRFLMSDANGNLFYKTNTPSLSNGCATLNYLTKTDANGNLTCSKFSDNGQFFKYGNPSVDYGYNQISGILNITDGYIKSYDGGGFMSIATNNNNPYNQATLSLHDATKSSSGNNDGAMWKMMNTRTNTDTGFKDGFTIASDFSMVPRFFIQDNTGNVGIGTITPPTGYKLAVAGKIIAEELKVQLQAQWPDYVFTNDYKLPTLAEVEKQIKEKGHLANVPPACEVKENGFEVGEMTRIQQEKIEELTLYIIELNKQLQAQEKRMQVLEAKVNN